MRILNNWRKSEKIAGVKKGAQVADLMNFSRVDGSGTLKEEVDKEHIRITRNLYIFKARVPE